MKIKFVPQDLWVGLFIGQEKYPLKGGRSRKLYLCLLPCFPIIVKVVWP